MGSSPALAALVLALLPSPAFADPDDYVAPAAREVEPARPLAVMVLQPRVASSIELGRILFPSGGGGILGTLIIDGQNNIPERLAASALARAEERIVPLVAVLEDFDVASLAKEATMAAMAETSWLGASPPELYAPARPAGAAEDDGPVYVSTTYREGMVGRESNDTEAGAAWAADVAAAQAAFRAAHADAPELAQVLWRYQMSPDFTQVQVIADVSLSRQGTGFYNQQLISIVRLNRPSFIEEENVARWADNDGALVQAALASAFARAGEVLPSIMALDQAGFTEATDRRRESVTSAGYHGPVLLRDETGPVFWARDGDQGLAAFVTVQVAAE
ncbi:MAG: hypothetical protein KDE15_00970 [Erythrobacter sp.]|nr:hypothetical protein [Erythrobacter sp.]